MQDLYVSEVFSKLADDSALPTNESKVEFLRKHNTPALRGVLRGIFDKEVEYFTNTLPPYQPDDAPLGINPLTVYNIHREFKIWETKSAYKDSIRERHMIQKLESMHEDECNLIEAMITKSPAKYKFLTEKLVEESFPELLSKS